LEIQTDSLIHCEHQVQVKKDGQKQYQAIFSRCYRKFDRSEILSRRSYFLGNFIAERYFFLGNIIAARKFDRSRKISSTSTFPERSHFFIEVHPCCTIEYAEKRLALV